MARFKDIFRWFTKPAGIGVTSIVAAVVALAGWGIFTTVLDKTNTLEFCISCHSMESTVYQEYKNSVHYKNASGVRAICSDCHVPKDLPHKLVAKTLAVKDLWHTILGTLDTTEKFEEHRLELAKRVWASMKARDSQECRNCHSFDAMDFHKQRPKAAEQMEKAAKAGDTCISCHKGIAHKLPDMSSGYKAMFSKLVEQSADKVGQAKAVFTLRSKPLFADKDGQDKVGVALPGTKLDVLDRSGDMLKVKLSGWRQDDVPQMVYAASGQRIFSAAFDTAGIDSIKVLSSELNQDTEQTWDKVEAEAWMAKDTLAVDEGEVWNYAGEMYSSNCSTCHSLRDPDHYLANQWIGNLDSMKRYASLDKEEYRLVLKYLQMHAQDMAGTRAH